MVMTPSRSRTSMPRITPWRLRSSVSARRRKADEDWTAAAQVLAEIVEADVAALRRRAAVIAGDQRDDLDLVGLEAAQVAVLDQVVRMAMMPLVADVVADVVQEARVLEPLALAIAEAVHALGVVEQRQRNRAPPAASGRLPSAQRSASSITERRRTSG